MKTWLPEILRRQTQQLIRGGITMFFEAHREEILQFLKTAQEERGAALLHDICQRVPAAAGVLTTLMGGTPEEAISNIAAFDPKFAAELRKNIGSFRKLQEAYARGSAQNAADGFEAGQ